MVVKKSILTLFVMASFFYCGSKDIRKEDTGLYKEEAAAKKGRAIFIDSFHRRGGDKIAKFQSLNITGRDVWQSTIVRWFTPVEEADQKFKLQMKWREEDILFTFVNGVEEPTQVGIKNGQGFRITSGQKENDDSSSLKLYLVPLRDYIAWPFTLVDNPIKVYEGETTINETKYHLVYSSSGESLDSDDQYRIYINQQTGDIEMIDFTMRKLMKSYKGTLVYQNFVTEQGLRLAKTIYITSEIEEKEDYDHKVILEEISFIQET